MLYYTIDPKLKPVKPEDIVKTPKIVTVNEFTEASAKVFRAEFDEAVNSGQNVIPVLIDSYGGQCYSLMSMMDTIKSSPLPVATIATGKAMSCGAILFSCGTDGYRIINPLATVLIHDVSSGSFGKVEEIKANASEVDRLNQLIYRTMARNCGQPEDYFLKLVHEKGHADWYLTPEDCVKHKLANRIGNFRINVKISVDIQFE